MEQIKSLLGRINLITSNYDKIAKITGEKFNIFNTLKLTSSEVKLHSVLIGELLNPHGTHGQGHIFLKTFCEQLEIKTFNWENATLELEKNIGYIDKDYEEGGNIDILITDDKKNAIIIENKIYAYDQKNQLLRYHNFGEKKCRSFELYYLTLDGKDASDFSTNSCGLIKYSKISFSDHILAWIEECKKLSVDQPILRETLKQYSYLIKHLTHQTVNDTMKQEIVNAILSNPQSIESAQEIFNNWDAAKTQIIGKLEDPIKEIAERLRLDCVIDEDLGYKDTGFYFFRKGWKYCIYFYFENKHERLLVSIDHVSYKDKGSETVTTDLKKIFKSFEYHTRLKYDNWIWIANFDPWNNCSWKDILTSIPSAIEETTVILLEKLDNYEKSFPIALSTNATIKTTVKN